MAVEAGDLDAVDAVGWEKPCIRLASYTPKNHHNKPGAEVLLAVPKGLARLAATAFTAAVAAAWPAACETLSINLSQGFLVLGEGALVNITTTNETTKTHGAGGGLVAAEAGFAVASAGGPTAAAGAAAAPAVPGYGGRSMAVSWSCAIRFMLPSSRSLSLMFLMRGSPP